MEFVLSLSVFQLVCYKVCKCSLLLTVIVNSSSSDSSGRPPADIDVLVGLRTAIVVGPIEFSQSDLRRTDDDCRHEPTDAVIRSLSSRRRCQYTFLLPFFCFFVFVLFCFGVFVCLFCFVLFLSLSVQSRGLRQKREVHFQGTSFLSGEESGEFSAPKAKQRAKGY